MHEYSGGRLLIYHFDFFRLTSEPEAVALGLDDYFSSGGVSIVEWPNRFPRLVPPTAKWVKIENLDPTRRSIQLP
jgi:tRNA threonylcarbamoyladenosine biosynthesis protein TsaE